MTKEMLNDLAISGRGSATGGKYKSVKVNGMAKISGDILCEKFRCNGTSVVEGDMEAEEIRVSGKSTFQGDIKSNDLKVDGSIKCMGGLSSSSHVVVNGYMSFKGNITGDQIDVKGNITGEKDVEAENLVVNGTLDIGGLVNAGNIEIRLYGECRATEIGGEKIKITPKDMPFNVNKLFKSLFQYEEKLIAQLIEGDEITISHTHAKLVRGNQVKIGAGCVIDRVEYKEKIEIDAKAEVKEEIKI
ncbi:polymer-forming cytoskeletal protein [Hazenella sp. IB182353]|uniref:polymer-forming cytoskeletal protein n=1 Tax=Polycladospora coralii TaxID=2771432 RepID=UPI001746C1A5|nr:polymer-forming cytoskeletal protein [Polycladospora coralii]MBS7530420.1 polymer-forming cytoskeletal protein [Polycladospora coralii]